jgi:hypothetical protein
VSHLTRNDEPPCDPNVLVRHIFTVLVLSEKPLVEFDVVMRVLAIHKPGEVWYQSICDALGSLVKCGRILESRRSALDALGIGFQFVEKTYAISNPLDSLAAI